MNTELLPHQRLSPQAHAALMGAARHRATLLRREAMHAASASLARRLRALWRALRRRGAKACQPTPLEA